MKKVLLFSACLASLISVQAQNEKKTAMVTKIAVVDFQNIVNMEDPTASASLEWQDLMKELQKKFESRLTRIQNMQAKLQKERKEALENNKNDEDTFAQLTKLQNDIEIDTKTYQSYSQKMFAEAQMQFVDKVQKVAKEVAIEFGWNRVDAMDGRILYVDEGFDITSEVTDRLNKNYRAEQRAKKFASSQKVEKSIAAAA